MGFSVLYTPEYLQQTSTGLFLFRLRVPKDCQRDIGKKELKYSLKTRSLREARKFTSSILSFLADAFNDIRLGVIEGDRTAKINHSITEAIRRARLNDSRPYVVYAPESPGTDPEPLQETPGPPQKYIDVQTIATSTPLFSTIREAFFNEKRVSQSWRLKTQEDHEAVFNLFTEVNGDVPVSSIDRTLLRDFKSIIIQLPSNMRKIPAFRDKTIPEIIKLKPEKTLSSHTINKYLSRLSNLFSYAVTHGYMNMNPAGSLKVKLKSRPDEERQAYTTEDLQKLFREPDTSKSFTYWSPLIALYTGCRLEEVCQLHLEDIRKEEDVWVFDINNKHEKSLKNLSSVRLIPIHTHLIKLGLLNNVNELKARGLQRLFPEIPKRRDGYGQMVSRWFSVYKDKCGIDKGKTFHSFRHTFITHLKHKQVDPFMIHELDGHTISSETMGRYGKRYTPEILLREAIEKIDYGLELIKL